MIAQVPRLVLQREYNPNPFVKMSAPVLSDATILARLEPREYYREWMAQYYPLRPDQRHALAYRPASIIAGTIGTAEASATVRLGDTTVIGAIKLEVAEPNVSSPGEGFLVTNVTLCAGCSPSIRMGPPSEKAQVLTNKMSNLLKRLDLVNLKEDLVIELGKLVWVVHLDAFVVNDAGNLHDAIWLAIMAVLKLCQLPQVRIDGETGMIYWNPQLTKPLNLRRLLMPLSFGVLEDSTSTKVHLIADPSDKEEVVFGSRKVEMLVDCADSRVYSIETAGSLDYSLVENAWMQDSGVKDHLGSLQSIFSAL